MATHAGTRSIEQVLSQLPSIPIGGPTLAPAEIARVIETLLADLKTSPPVRKTTLTGDYRGEGRRQTRSMVLRAGRARRHLSLSPLNPSSLTSQPQSKRRFVMANTVKGNRLSQLAADQKLVEGIKQLLSQMASFPVGGQDMTPAQITQVLEGRIDKGKAAAAAADARTAAVKADRDERKATAPVVHAFKRIVLGMFLQAPDKLGVFGLMPPKRGKTKVAVKAAAAVKVDATKKARGPIGKKQRAKVHAAPAATPPVTTPPGAPAPTPAPVPRPAPAATTAPPATAVAPAPVTPAPVPGA